MARERKIGIKDVAAAAGVSITTVSHALNGKGRLPQHTREHVSKVARELGYSPSVFARNLVAGKTGVLGLAVSELGTPASAMTAFGFFIQLLMAASTEALRHGYALMLAPADANLTLSGITAIDGAIVVDPVRDDPLVTDLRETGVPVVTAGRTLGMEGGYWVDNDQVAGALTVLTHLARQGSRRPALVTTSADISYTTDIKAAYVDWCAEHSTPPLITTTGPTATERAGVAATAELLDMEDPPDAIFATYDSLALGALLAAEARGIRVPDHLLLATVGTGSRAPADVKPSLTTLGLNPEEIGRRAAEMLVQLIDGEQPAQRHVVVRHRLIARRSTKR